MGAVLSCARPRAEGGDSKGGQSLLVARPLGPAAGAAAAGGPVGNGAREATTTTTGLSSSRNRRRKSTSMDKRRRSSFGSAPPGSAASGPGSDTSGGRGDALQTPDGDGSAETNAGASGGGAPLRSSSTLSASAAAAASAAASDENNSTPEEEVTIGGGIFKAISDAASQEGPLQGKAFDSYAFGPPRPPCNAERVAELRMLCSDALGPAPNSNNGDEAKGSGGGGNSGGSGGGNSGGSGTSLSSASSASSATAVLPSKAPPASCCPVAPSLAAPNPHIEHIISLICRLFDVQDALLALLDGERVFIRDAAGKKFKRGDFPWSCSFCGWSLANPTPQTLIVPDAREDARFDQNPFVRGPPYMRFYAGAPVVGRSGHRLGTLCFADTKPRALGPAGAATLNTLAELVAVELERDAAARAAAAAAARVTAAGRAGAAMRALELGGCGALLVDTRGGSGNGSGNNNSGGGGKRWSVLHASADAAAALGLAADGRAAEGLDFWELFEPPKLRGGAAATAATAKAGGGNPSDPLSRLQTAADSGRFFSVRGARAKRTSAVAVASSAASSSSAAAASSSSEPNNSASIASGETRLFDLSFWPSALGPPGDLPAVGVPASIAGGGAAAAAAAKARGSAASSSSAGGNETDSSSSSSLGGGGIYCVTLSLAFFAGGSPRTTAVNAAGAATVAASPSLAPRPTFLPEATLSSSAPPPIPGLRLGVLVGKGAHGTVFCGSLRGAGTVAVKVVPDDARVPRAPDGTPLEALLSARLRHPNLVRMRAAARSAPPPGPHDSAGSYDGGAGGIVAASAAGWNLGGAKGSGGGGGGSKGSGGAPPTSAASAAAGACAAPGGVPAAARGATWMVMDFCGGGTLLDAAERGVLRTARAMAGAAGIADEEVDVPTSSSPFNGDGGKRPSAPRRRARVSPAALAAAAADVAAGVLALHTAGVAHGDLTGTNVLLASAASLLEAEGGGEAAASSAAGESAAAAVGGKWRAVVADYGLAAPLAGCSTGIFGSGAAAAASAAAADESASVAAGWRSLSSVGGSGGKGSSSSSFAMPAFSPSPRSSLDAGQRTSAVSSSSNASNSNNGNGFELHPLPEAIVGAPPYGTVTHMPPEVLASGSGPSAAGDAWAFGVLLWELAHGSRAWASMSHAQVVAAVAVRKTLLKWDDVVGEGEGGEESPLAWAAALAADCWKEDPAARPGFGEICERLRAELARMRKKASSSSSSTSSPSPAPACEQAAAAGVAAATAQAA